MPSAEAPAIAVLDASALLAFLRDEPGAEIVADVLDGRAGHQRGELGRGARQGVRGWARSRSARDRASSPPVAYLSVWFSRFTKGDYQITSAYQERTIDPDNLYSLVLKTGAPINTTGYSSPRADGLIERAARETDPAKRKALYLELKRLVWEDAPLVFVHYETLNYLMRKQVAGSTINPTLELRMQNVGRAA